MADSKEKTLEETLDMVAVPKTEYESLLKAQEFLNALEDLGVDSWDGYELAKDRANW